MLSRGLSRKTIEGTTTALLHIILLFGAAVMVLPFVWMILTSFKPTDEVLSWPPKLFPHHWTLSNYIGVFQRWPFGRFIMNSLVLSAVSTVSIIITSTLSGFVFSKYRFVGKEAIFFLLLATVMVPFQVFMVPLYLSMAKAGLVDTYGGIVLPWLIMSFGIFFMRQNIASIPDELIDAARIDGCSEFGIFLNVIFPLSKSAMSALAIFAFMDAWGYFIWPLIITSTTEKFVLEVGLALFQHRFFIDYGSTTAGSTIAILPVIIVFMIFRRNIIEGVTLTGRIAMVD
ncbi:MAG TPA: carbohydrate ABC transporter permease, partial [Spirochaetales bacterium]|nr:carbohydrate ABC transporter permease [Spirochaetales bacterium]